LRPVGGAGPRPQRDS